MSVTELYLDDQRETSKLAILVDDDALTDFSTDPATGNVILCGRCGMFSLFVEAYPESGHEIRMKLQSTWRDDIATWATQWDGNADDVAPQVFIFKEATLADEPIEIGPFYGGAVAIRCKYGYNGGSGDGAVLKVYVRGRAQ